MYLEGLIAKLKTLDPKMVFKNGFSHPHSYRGEYVDLAFEPTENTTVETMLAAATSALGRTFEGYKGGEFTMHGDTCVWLAHYGNCGDRLSEKLFDYMAEESRAYAKKDTELLEGLIRALAHYRAIERGDDSIAHKALNEYSRRIGKNV